MKYLLILPTLFVCYGFLKMCGFKFPKMHIHEEDEEQTRRFDYLMLMLSGVRTDNDLLLFSDEVKIKLKEKDYDHYRYATLHRHYTEIKDLLQRIRIKEGDQILS